MDIWSWIIVSLIILIAILLVFETLSLQNKEKANIIPLCAAIYQTKEYINFVSTFYNHFSQIKTQLPQINDRELKNIFIAVLNKSSVLANVTFWRAEKAFDYIKNKSINNTTMLSEDKELTEDFLKSKFGSDYDNYDFNLHSDNLASIHKILKEEIDKIVPENTKR